MTRRQHNIDKAIDALKALLVRMEDLEPSIDDYKTDGDYCESFVSHEQRIRNLNYLKTSLEAELGDVE